MVVLKGNKPYKDSFCEIHNLLKEYGCEPTFSFEPEFKEHPVLAGYRFYKPESEMNNDKFLPEWQEKVDARLDVCIKTKKGFSEKDLLRFDIEWSREKNLYSMYISSPTSSRSKSLSLNIYKSQDDVMIEVKKWLIYARCRRAVQSDSKVKSEMEFEQISLF
ncbi:hypothetical protein [Desulfitobacterium hafniense]|uniref:hypothetical protein n=1 Tax=Desulfitobacterium hafniense TaxID=49338 RepID=UPI00037D53AC|nr:hypothetical protein [Desulfitobacterium hafniense]